MIILSVKNSELKGEIQLYETKIRSYENLEAGISVKEKESLNNIKNNSEQELKKIESKYNALKEKEIQLNEKTKIYHGKLDILEKREKKIELMKSNLKTIPYMAAIIADFDTRGIQILADKLDWGSNVERAKKVESIREIRKNAKELIEQYQAAYYNLEYLKQMFPSIVDFIDSEYTEVKKVGFDVISNSDHDKVRDFLTHDEYITLTESERNQLALDRYVRSHHKSNWQIGRDYELYVGYKYSQQGYDVEYFGEYNGINDLGRDLIAQKGDDTLIIQCKYWSATKTIHENHVNQLFGTTICYCLAHNVPVEYVRPVLVTNIGLSPTAEIFAKYLNITVIDKFPMHDYPRIKCNINKDSYGDKTYIYHLPFDQQYDSCKIDSPGEFFAMTVKEAEDAGFRRAYRWHSE